MNEGHFAIADRGIINCGEYILHGSQAYYRGFGGTVK